MQLHGGSEIGEPTNLVVQLARFSARKHVQRARSLLLYCVVTLSMLLWELCGNTAVMYVLVHGSACLRVCKDRSYGLVTIAKL